MRIGVVYPQTEFPPDPLAVRDFAQTAEGLGFTHILAYDHVLGASPDRPGGLNGPYTFRDPFLSPLLLFSYLAGLTQKIEFTTGVIILPQRQTALVAKQAATLDVLSGGRFRMGVGIGWNEVEYTALNAEFHTRGIQSEEQVQVLRALWAEALVTYHGRWHHIPEAGINPLPVKRSIPIWFGGHADLVLRRTAKLGDGWMPNYRTPDQARPALQRLGEYIQTAGRRPTDIGLEPRLRYENGDSSTWTELMHAWESAGATHFTVNSMGAGFTTANEHIQAMQKFARVLGVA